MGGQERARPVRTILRSRSWLAAQNGGRRQAGEQLQLVRIQGLQSYLQSSDGKHSFKRKRSGEASRDVLDGKNRSVDFSGRTQMHPRH